MKRRATSRNGFTLIELMIVVAIVGILAAIAVPAYQNYVRKSRFTEVTLAAKGIKAFVEECAILNQGVGPCDAGTNGVPPTDNNATAYKASVDTAAGAITATATHSGGLAGETYVLQPAFNAVSGQVTWSVGGTCVGVGLCRAGVQ